MIISETSGRSINRTSVKLALDIIKQYKKEGIEPCKVLREEVAYEIQKDMIQAGLVMPLSAITVVSKNEVANDDELNQIILKLISQNEIFQYRYADENQEILLRVVETKKYRTILKLFEADEQYVQSIVQTTNQILKKELSKNFWNSELFFVYIIETNSKYLINFVVSHIISDAGIGTALNRGVRNIITNNTDNTPQYKDYVCRIRQTPRENSYSLLLKEFIALNQKNNKVLDMLSKERKAVKIPTNVPLKNWDSILLESAFVIGDKILTHMGIENLVMKVSYNFRNAFDEQYQCLLGDCHSYFFVMMKADDTLESFSERNLAYLDLIRKEKIECGYFCAKEEPVYKKIYDSTRVNINLVTENYLNEDEVMQYLDVSLALNQKVLSSSTNRIDMVLYKKNYYMYISQNLCD